MRCGWSRLAVLAWRVYLRAPLVVVRRALVRADAAALGLDADPRRRRADGRAARLRRRRRLRDGDRRGVRPPSHVAGQPPGLRAGGCDRHLRLVAGHDGLPDDGPQRGLERSRPPLERGRGQRARHLAAAPGARRRAPRQGRLRWRSRGLPRGRAPAPRGSEHAPGSRRVAPDGRPAGRVGPRARRSRPPLARAWRRPKPPAA